MSKVLPTPGAAPKYTRSVPRFAADVVEGDHAGSVTAPSSLARSGLAEPRGRNPEHPAAHGELDCPAWGAANTAPISSASATATRRWSSDAFAPGDGSRTNRPSSWPRPST